MTWPTHLILSDVFSALNYFHFSQLHFSIILNLDDSHIVTITNWECFIDRLTT